MILGNTATLKKEGKDANFEFHQLTSESHVLARKVAYAAASSRRFCVNSSMNRVNWSKRW
jgi:hypothetical protein